MGDTDTTYNFVLDVSPFPVTANAMAPLSPCVSCIIALLFSSERSIQLALLGSLLQLVGPRADVFPPRLPPLRALVRITLCPYSRPRPNPRPPFVLRSIMSVRCHYRGGHVSVRPPQTSNLIARLEAGRLWMGWGFAREAFLEKGPDVSRSNFRCPRTTTKKSAEYVCHHTTPVYRLNPLPTPR